ncbi:MAG: magnesium transporter CorA family protein [Polyangiaceae bacterium]|nr:magnesium transporter CorA family protein [Polyangiaceae bacterium]
MANHSIPPVSGSAPKGPTPGHPFIVAFDFDRKVEERLELGAVRNSMIDGRFVWVDVDITEAAETKAALTRLNLCADEIIDDALTGEPATQSGRYDDYLHFVVTGCRLTDKHFELERVDVVIGEKFLLTMHRGPVVFLDSVRKVYKSDFMRFAKSPSFLIYEIWDHLVENYLLVQKRFEERVEKLQTELIGEVDDRVFARVSELGADLLHFRKVLLPARAVLSDLGSRKTLYISEATQPFLVNMVGTLERVLQDLLADRDILNDSLNLYVSMVGHRTNRVMNRLTVVSVIFLPLTFLCGVYGMNFEVLPETKWQYGYVYFWASVVLIVAALLWLMRKNKLL